MEMCLDILRTGVGLISDISLDFLSLIPINKTSHVPQGDIVYGKTFLEINYTTNLDKTHFRASFNPLVTSAI